MTRLPKPAILTLDLTDPDVILTLPEDVKPKQPEEVVEEGSPSKTGKVGAMPFSFLWDGVGVGLAFIISEGIPFLKPSILGCLRPMFSLCRH